MITTTDDYHYQVRSAFALELLNVDVGVQGRCPMYCFVLVNIAC